MSNFKISAEDKEKLDSIVITMDEQTAIFNKNNAAFLTKGNKQAAKRARVASLKLAKATKKYRAESMRVLAQTS